MTREWVTSRMGMSHIEPKWVMSRMKESLFFCTGEWVMCGMLHSYCDLTPSYVTWLISVRWLNHIWYIVTKHQNMQIYRHSHANKLLPFHKFSHVRTCSHICKCLTDNNTHNKHHHSTRFQKTNHAKRSSRTIQPNTYVRTHLCTPMDIVRQHLRTHFQNRQRKTL